MYNLLEQSKNFVELLQRLNSKILWNYYRDEPYSGTDANNITHSILNSESFDYKGNFIEDGVTQII